MCTLKNFEKFFNEKIDIYKNNKIKNSIWEEIDNLILYKSNYKCLLTENSFDVKNRAGNWIITTTHIARCFLDSDLEIWDIIATNRWNKLKVYYIKKIINLQWKSDHLLVFLRR